MSLALRFIESRQWAILDDYLRLMAAIADRDLDHRSVSCRLRIPMKGPRSLEVKIKGTTLGTTLTQA